MIWPRKPLLTLAAFAALLAVPHQVPRLARCRIVELAAAAKVLEFTPRPASLAPLEDEAELRDPVAGAAASDLIADEQNSLDPFFAELLRTERNEPGAVTRILHYGDSPTTADLITADLRHLLQTRFGDAGHGLHLLARPWAWYGHRGVDVTAAGWKTAPVTHRGEADGWYGVAGVSFTGQAGAWSRFSLRSPRHTQLVIYYAGGPEGGELAVRAGGAELTSIDTALPAPAAARRTVTLPAGLQEVELRVRRGTVRLFAVSFEAPGPGLIYDSLGLNGVSAAALVYFMNEAHWAAQLRAARPSLVILNYGTNESGFEKYINSTYREDLRKLVRRTRRALPDTPLMLMSPMDRGVREGTGAIGTIAALPKLVAIQREVAREEGCAFFDTFAAMGGKGTMGKWYLSEPRLVSADFIHPLPAGGRIVANLLERAIMRGYNLYKLRLLRAPRLAEARP